MYYLYDLDTLSGVVYCIRRTRREERGADEFLLGALRQADALSHDRHSDTPSSEKQHNKGYSLRPS